MGQEAPAPCSVPPSPALQRHAHPVQSPSPVPPPTQSCPPAPTHPGLPPSPLSVDPRSLPPGAAFPQPWAPFPVGHPESVPSWSWPPTHSGPWHTSVWPGAAAEPSPTLSPAPNPARMEARYPLSVGSTRPLTRVPRTVPAGHPVGFRATCGVCGACSGLTTSALGTRLQSKPTVRYTCLTWRGTLPDVRRAPGLTPDPTSPDPQL